MNLQDKIAELRKEENFSRDELAERLGVPRRLVTDWETGEALPDAENLKKMSRLFDVTPDFLLDDSMDIETFRSTRVAEPLSGKERVTSKLYLIAAVAFGIATLAFSIVAINKLSGVYILLTLACVVLAGANLYLYAKMTAGRR